MKATLAPAASAADEAALLAMREQFLAEVGYHFGVERDDDGHRVVPEGLRADRPGLESHLIRVQDRRVGYVDLQPPAEGEHGQVMATFVVPDMRRRGIASWALWTWFETSADDWALDVPLGLPSAVGFVEVVLSGCRRSVDLDVGTFPGPTSSMWRALVHGEVDLGPDLDPSIPSSDGVQPREQLVPLHAVEDVGALILLVWGFHELDTSSQRLRDHPTYDSRDMVDGQWVLTEVPPLAAPEPASWTLHMALIGYLIGRAAISRADAREGRSTGARPAWRFYGVMALGLTGLNLLQYGGLAEGALGSSLPIFGGLSLAAAALLFIQLLRGRPAASGPTDPDPTP